MTVERPPPSGPSGAAQPRILLSAATICGLLLVYAALVYGTHDVDVIQDGDFFALWSYGAIVAGHRTADLYNFDRLHALQVGLGMDPERHNPFPYLPTFLPVVRALGALPLRMAYAAWIALGTAAFALAIAPASVRRAVVTAALVSPAAKVCFVYGQGGLLWGALLLGGLRLIQRRPWLAGGLLGLLTLKPQLGLLVPVALVSASAWRSIAAAAAVAAGLAAASLAFGVSAWGEWFAALPGYQAWFENWGASVRLLPTVTAFLLNAGLSQSAADAGQAVAAVVMAAVIWRLFRAGPGQRAIAAFPAATLLATPHALVYDMPMLAGSVVLGLAGLPSMSSAAWPILALAAPTLMVSSLTPWPIGAPLIACYLAWAVRRPMPGAALGGAYERARSRTASRGEPGAALAQAEPQTQP